MGASQVYKWVNFLIWEQKTPLFFWPSACCVSSTVLDARRKTKAVQDRAVLDSQPYWWSKKCVFEVIKEKYKGAASEKWDLWCNLVPTTSGWSVRGRIKLRGGAIEEASQWPFTGREMGRSLHTRGFPQCYIPREQWVRWVWQLVNNKVDWRVRRHIWSL